MSIGSIRLNDGLQPLWLTGRDSCQLPRGISGQGICYAIFDTLAVYNLVLEPNQLSEYLLLPWGVKSLFRELNQAAVVSDDLELGMLEVTAPLLQSQQSGHVFFFVCGQPQ